MNPLKPVTNIIEAVTFPFTALFVVGICTLINWMTSPGHWWVQWVALGMGIALLAKWMRALKTIFGAAVVGGLGVLAYRWYQNRRRSNPTGQAAEASKTAANVSS